MRAFRAELRVGLGAKEGALALAPPPVDTDLAAVRDDPVARNCDRNSIGEARLSDSERVAGNAYPPGDFGIRALFAGRDGSKFFPDALLKGRALTSNGRLTPMRGSSVKLTMLEPMPSSP